MGDEYRGPMAPYLGVLGSFNEFDSLYAQDDRILVQLIEDEPIPSILTLPYDG